MISRWEWNPSQLHIYLEEGNIFIAFWTLKVKCKQYEFCGQATIKNARTIFSLKSGGVGNIGRDQKKKKIEIFLGA